MSADTQPQWKLDKLGEYGEPRDVRGTKERTIAYAEATNDENPQHPRGELAPPVFAVVPVFEVAARPSMATSCRASCWRRPRRWPRRS